MEDFAVPGHRRGSVLYHDENGYLYTLEARGLRCVNRRSVKCPGAAAFVVEDENHRIVQRFPHTCVLDPTKAEDSSNASVKRKITDFFCNPVVKKQHMNMTVADNEGAMHVSPARSPHPSSPCRRSASEGEKTASNSDQPNDIGCYVHLGSSDLPKSTLQQLLENPWTPPQGYVYPFSVHQKDGKTERRFVGKQHLDKYEWLVLSDVKRGLFCKFCPFFATGRVGGQNKNTNLCSLVTEPVIKFSKLTGENGVLEKHNRANYHKEAVEAGLNFLRGMHDPKAMICNQLDSHRMRQITENRERLICSLQNIEFLGRQGLGLRGHRESGKLEASTTGVNEGNFRELLKFRRACGDEKVEKHLLTATSRTVYTSPVVQNDLIESCGMDITKQIVARVNVLGFYAIIFDETTDVSQTSQLSFSVRYVHVNEDRKHYIREDFLCFVDPRQMLESFHNENQALVVGVVESDEEISEDENDNEPGEGELEEEIPLTGINLGRVVVELIRQHGLDPKNCVAIGTDGCSVNVSDTVGAVQEIRKVATNAVRVPCQNHALNLSISKSSDVPAVKKAVALIRDVGNFFRSSSKKQRKLKKYLKRCLPKVCETRWVERHEAVLVFCEYLPQVVSALNSITNWKDTNTSRQANSLLASLLESEFLVTLFCLRDILAVTVSLSRLLQKENIDMAQATGAVKDTISVLQGKRKMSEGFFNRIFQDVLLIADELGVEIRTPRGTYRGKYPTQEPEPFYRQTIYIPMLENVVSDIKERLSDEVLGCFSLNMFLPSELMRNTTKITDIDGIAAKYAALLGVNPKNLSSLLTSETSLWAARWARKQSEDGSLVPTVVESIDFCDVELYPNLKKMLIVLACMPCSVATAERTFSSLRRLKNWLRSTMAENRLNGLALLYIHRDINIHYDSVISQFAKKNERRGKKLLI